MIIREKSVYLSVLLIAFSAILNPHKNVLKVIKFIYRGSAISTTGFISYNVFPLIPGATAEVIQGLVPWPMVVVTISYLVLMYVLSLMFLQVADNCTIQLKNRFNLAP